MIRIDMIETGSGKLAVKSGILPPQKKGSKKGVRTLFRAASRHLRLFSGEKGF
jgi:hypothetical protein